MLVTLWHHWLLLRPLLVFALAGPLIVIAVLVRFRHRPRRSQAAGESESHVKAGPKPWQPGGVSPDRRAA